MEIQNSGLYNGFIEILAEVLNCSKYAAVCLTVPDNKLRWNDGANDNAEHFLVNEKATINTSICDYLEIVLRNAPWLPNRCRNSLSSVYAYRDFDYIKRMLENITGEDQQDVGSAILTILRRFNHNSSTRNFCAECGLPEFLEGIEPLNEWTQDYYRNGFINLFVCLNKLFCAVILYSIDYYIPDNFNVKPSLCSITDDIQNNYIKIKNLTECYTHLSDNRVVDLYNELYDLINMLPNEILNFMANECYYNFFKFINSRDLQDQYIFRGGYSAEKIFGLYDIFDMQIKYKLYRDHGRLGINNGIGLMRCSLTDRKYVRELLSNPIREVYFDRATISGGRQHFGLRYANENDFMAIKQLNNPAVPYRRAIFVKSDDDEIRRAIAKREAYVIECLSGERAVLACIAIILDSEVNNGNFHTSTICQRHAQESKIIGNRNRQIKYLDFHSVITNNGEAGLGNNSYRGYGFQRLMLVLAEELAMHKNYDYVFATVSPLNKSSHRNFELNGFKSMKYADEYETTSSPYYDYVKRSGIGNEHIATALTEYQKMQAAAARLGIRLRVTQNEYIEDIKSPRDFVYLEII